jgi:5-(carboxyamino)imidazole ribonucleotide mutase
LLAIGVSTKRKSADGPLVGIVMGSDSDWSKMEAAAQACAEFGIQVEVRAISAHRNPTEAAKYARTAEGRGLRVIIAGAGLAAHLPGVLAAFTPLPVVGVPVGAGPLQGQDALLSIAQMPPGVPVACVAINGARNAGLLAVQILATADPALRARYADYKKNLVRQSRAKDKALRKRIG